MIHSETMTRRAGARPLTTPRFATFALWVIALSACRYPSDEGATGNGAESEGVQAATATAKPCVSGSWASDTRCALAAIKERREDVASCDEPVAVFADGEPIGELCASQIESAGLTLIDLGDDWAPRVLTGSPSAPVPYRDTYARLAGEELGEEAAWDRARRDRFLELYGIFPSLSVIAKRLGDRARHTCHDAVDDAALERLEEAVDTWKPLVDQKGAQGRRNQLEKLLTKASRDMHLESIHDLADHAHYRAHYREWDRLDTRIDAIDEMQRHLRCEGLLKRGEIGMLDGATIDALQAYHRRHMVVSWQLDDETRRVLSTNSRELDFRTLLRALRERVVDATGLIEDGSAADQPGTVLDRVLDASAFIRSPVRAGEAGSLEGAAPDLISGATDVAARALGWMSPAAALTFLLRVDRPARVAVKLPPRPYYHQAHMELRIEIDRGDVWYDFPYASNGDRYLQPVERRPSLVVYADHGGKEIPLLRWPTTIGGWNPETLDNGRVSLVYKESPVGSRIVRDIVAEPRWIPPESTPPRDLVRPRGEGRWAVRYDTFGPGYASAYGLVMMIHHRVDGAGAGGLNLTDQGIRSHGSVSYDSIHDGFSHGCHRLHNHRAVRLSGFVLAHRRHEVRGPIRLDYARTFAWRDKALRMELESRGFRYELTPPLHVDVLPGRVFGDAKGPLPPRALTAPLAKRYL